MPIWLSEDAGGLDALQFRISGEGVWMEGFVRFDELRAHANSAQPEAPSSESFPSEGIIHQLRKRLSSPDFRDPIEVKVAILGEIGCACYYQLMRRILQDGTTEGEDQERPLRRGIGPAATQPCAG